MPTGSDISRTNRMWFHASHRNGHRKNSVQEKRRVQNDEIHDHYVGKRIQNELFTVMGENVWLEIIKRIQSAKYFAVILDCASDSSHTEQMSPTIRFVSVCDNIPVGI